MIIYNMEESGKENAAERKEDDRKEVIRIMNKAAELDEKEIGEVYRLGKVGGNRPRLIKVTLKCEKKKREIVKNAAIINKGVTEIEKRIYINNDESEAERKASFELRKQLKEKKKETGEEDWVIRGGKIVKKDKKTSKGASDHAN